MTDLPPCQAASELRRLTDAALSAVAPDGAVLRHLHLDGGKLTLIDESGAPAWSGGLDAYRRIRVLGAGKGAAPMAAALENLLGDRISDGLVIVKYGHDLPEGQRTRHIRIKEGGHPVPDEAGAAAAGEIVDMARDSREDDLVLCTFTGGASALTPALHPEIPLADMQRLTCMLLECGATIHEINTLRKHLSRFSGGSLVRAAFRPPCSGSSYPMWWATTLTSSPPAHRARSEHLRRLPAGSGALRPALENAAIDLGTYRRRAPRPHPGNAEGGRTGFRARPQRARGLGETGLGSGGRTRPRGAASCPASSRRP